jgi:hypothetical protein
MAEHLVRRVLDVDLRTEPPTTWPVSTGGSRVTTAEKPGKAELGLAMFAGRRGLFDDRTVNDLGTNVVGQCE